MISTKTMNILCLSILFLTMALSPVFAQNEMPAVYPAAILPFEERGSAVKDLGQKAADILFAKLSAQSELMLVERRDIETILQEAEINLSGMVNPSEATKVGQLIGAKIIITGSVFEVTQKLYLVAKIIGTETSRVIAVSANGRMDELAALSEQLADQVAQTITQKSSQLVPKTTTTSDRVTELKKKVAGKKLPKAFVLIPENHIGQVTYDPAAQTELVLILKECGFDVTENSADADILFTGEGFSEFALRKGNLVSVKARLEVKAADKNGQLIATDRSVTIEVDLTEQIAGKKALQEASAQIAERMIPKIVK